jgi:hypothetical protein
MLQLYTPIQKIKHFFKIIKSQKVLNFLPNNPNEMSPINHRLNQACLLLHHTVLLVNQISLPVI